MDIKVNRGRSGTARKAQFGGASPNKWVFNAKLF